MTLGAEAWLMLLATALYLYDSVWLLSGNEAVLSRGWRGDWQAGFGSLRWRLRSREPFLPNPFTPHCPQFRLRWRFEGLVPRNPEAVVLAVPEALDGLVPYVCTEAVLLFVLLPIDLFANLGLAYTAGTVAALYLVNLAALTRLWRIHATLKLTHRQFAQIAFECLACPPFAVNLLRRLCLSVPRSEDFVQAAGRLLGPAALQAAHAQCLLRLDDQIECEPETGPRSQALLAARQRFVADTLGQPGGPPAG